MSNKIAYLPGMMTYAFSHSTQEAEAGSIYEFEEQVLGQPKLRSKTQTNISQLGMSIL